MSADGLTVAASAAAGYVRVYRFEQSNTTEWRQLGEDFTGLVFDSAFAPKPRFALAADGMTVAVGKNEGVSVVNYTEDEDTWRQLGDNFTQSSTAAFDLASDGRTLIIASSVDCGTTGYASAYQYNKATNEWLQLGQDVNGTSCFGRVVAASEDGSSFAVGGSGGYTQLFTYSPILGDWNETQRFQAISSSGADSFGRTISMSGNGSRIAISAPLYSTTQAGYVDMFQMDSGSGGWTRLGQTLFGGAYDDLGNGIALSSNGNVLAAGGNGCKSCGQTGFMNIYQFNDETGQWVGRASFRGIFFGFGSSVALSATGEYVIVGDPRVASNSGQVRIYRALQPATVISETP
jgi:N-acetylneuraminic acid mutarotase